MNFCNRLSGFAALCVLPLSVMAAPVAVSDAYQWIDRYGTNTIGATAGVYDAFGAQNVVPNGSGGTTATASRGGTTVSLPWVGGTANPNQYSRTVTYNAASTGAWQLNFSNGPDTATATTPTIATATLVPFVRDVLISGASLTPTFTWSIPAGANADAVRVNIYDHGQVRESGGGIDLAYSRTFSSSTTSFTVPASLANGIPLRAENRYSLEIGVLDTRSNGVPSAQADILSRSRTFVDFVPLNSVGGVGAYLPVVTPGVNGAPPVFTFDIGSVGTNLIYIDPLVAVGYDYAKGAGNPNFASVLLPGGIGDGLYDVTFGGQTFHVQGGESFSFGAGGTAAFRVTGIETSAGLVPEDPTAFMTGVSFVDAGQFTGTMIPITELVTVGAIPEPETYALMLAGLGVIGWAARRRRP